MKNINILVLFFFLLCAITSIASPRHEDFSSIKLFTGRWKEDQSQRKNLGAFLKTVGVSWIRRTYAITNSWENEQDIQLIRSNPSYFKIYMTNGPYAEEMVFEVYHDGVTKSYIDLGYDLGGRCDCTARFVSPNRFEATLRKKNGKQDWMKVTREMNPVDPNEMAFVTKHLPSGEEMSQIYYRTE